MRGTLTATEHTAPMRMQVTKQKGKRSTSPAATAADPNPWELPHNNRENAGYQRTYLTLKDLRGEVFSKMCFRNSNFDGVLRTVIKEKLWGTNRDLIQADKKQKKTSGPLVMNSEVKTENSRLSSIQDLISQVSLTTLVAWSKDLPFCEIYKALILY